MSVLVGGRIRAYVILGVCKRCPVMDSAASPMLTRFRPTIWVSAAVLGALAGGTILMWVHYGSATFFEMIIAGLVACF